MKRTEIGQFLKLAENIPLIDVRSPLEFETGHIPGAVNIPLFDNEQRAIVGTKYKKEGHVPAVVEGIKLSGPSMHEKLETAIKAAENGKLLVHCWRGGMRSEAMAWLFSIGGIETEVLEGGYKAYRHHVLENLSEERKMIVLGGMTGSSKTHILRYLKENGQQAIDLERLANHKGSAFGSLGEPPQPSTEQFANDLYYQWCRLDPGVPVWLEDESRNIGSVFMPEGFYSNMQKTKTVVLLMDIKTRMPRLMEEYSKYPPEMLKSSVMKISRRLGGDNTKEAIEAIDNGNISKAIEISLKYYDKTYLYSIQRKNNPGIIYVETGTDDIETNAARILEAAGNP
ncbi:MAG: tRNA 2-selenouridine(34) synthase MnmH [Chloroflexota bacterium]